MAGTVEVTPTPRSMNQSGKKIEVLSVAWTSDASGDATGTLERLYGFVMKVVFNPTDSPTDNYDVTLIDENGIDALAGAGVDRDTANTEQVYPTPTGSSVPAFLCGNHTFTVANAGATKSGVCVFYIIESL